MKWLIYTLVLIGIVLLSVVAYTYMSSRPEANSLTEGNAQVIEVARKELLKNDIELENYEITTVNKENATVVIFMPPNQEEGALGNSSDQPGFEVTVRADLTVDRMSLVR